MNDRSANPIPSTSDDDGILIRKAFDPHGSDSLSRDMGLDPSLSWKAKGLYWGMRSLPPNSRPTVDMLAALGQDGQDAVRTALRELRSHGWVEMRRIARKNRSPLTVYTVFESPNPLSVDVLAGHAR